jgi:hypothetical protein
MNGENAMTSWALPIQFVLCYRSIIFPFKKHLQSILLIVSLLFSKSFNNNIPFGVLLNIHLIVIILVQKVRKSFIVKLQIWNRHFYLVLISRIDLLIQFRE